MDGTLIQAGASHKSFQPKGGPHDRPTGGGRKCHTDWKGRHRSHDTHQSAIDPDARRFRKSRGSPAILCYHGYVLLESRSGLLAGTVVSHDANGFAECASALRLLDCLRGRYAKMCREVRPSMTLPLQRLLRCAT